MWVSIHFFILFNQFTMENAGNIATPSRIWRFAHKRASFKRHLMAYILINAGLWLILSLRQGVQTEMLWFSLGWGMGLFFHFWGTYFGNGDYFHKKEYQKLERELVDEVEE